MSLVRSFYAPLFGACAVVGGCMELFMIQTGFYEKVTALEETRLQEQQRLVNLNLELRTSSPKR